MAIATGAYRASGGALLTTLALGAIAQATASTHLPCPRKGAEVIASDRLVQVYAYPPRKFLRRLLRLGAKRKAYPPPPRTEACLLA